jgi:hypothetical protein
MPLLSLLRFFSTHCKKDATKADILSESIGGAFTMQASLLSADETSIASLVRDAKVVESFANERCRRVACADANTLLFIHIVLSLPRRTYWPATRLKRDEKAMRRHSLAGEYISGAALNAAASFAVVTT